MSKRGKRRDKYKLQPHEDEEAGTSNAAVAMKIPTTKRQRLLRCAAALGSADSTFQQGWVDVPVSSDGQSGLVSNTAVSQRHPTSVTIAQSFHPVQGTKRGYTRLASQTQQDMHISGTNCTYTEVGVQYGVVNAHNQQLQTEGLAAILPSEDHGVCVNWVPLQQSSILAVIAPCSFCKAKRFQYEPPGFCCSSNQIKLAEHPPPNALWELFTATSCISKEFQTYVRTYNNTFAFTSMGVTYDAALCHRNQGIYTFKAQGQVYHYINALLPTTTKVSHLQLYFYDTEHEMTNRLQGSSYVKPALITRIVDILKNNPYSKFFRSLADLPTLGDCSIVLKTVPSKDQRVYNAPTSSQVAAIWVDSAEIAPPARDIIVYSKPGAPIRIWYYYGCYDALQYPLLFPLGETGWHRHIKRVTDAKGRVIEGATLPNTITQANVDHFLAEEARDMEDGRKTRDEVSCCEYYCFKFQIRPGRSILLHAGRLLQQFAVDMYIKLESSRLDFFRHHQQQIRADLYSGLVDSIAIGERRGFKIGSRVVLPASFIGGPRDMRRRYLDAMRLVQRFGKPDFFLTMTCNPSWPEIKRELLPGEEAHNRPDLLARIFKAKVEEVRYDIRKRKIFGEVAAHVYVIEFQKRGLPHVHMLLIMKQGYKIRLPQQFDEFVSAELPPKSENPHLHRAVVKHMMHGPCGHLNFRNVCMKNSSCKNHYPKAFCEQTTQAEDSYPLYKRSDDNQTIRVRGHDLDNRWVIPYNPYLLSKFDCHFNVEICSTVKAVKYLYKYIYKGHDRVAFNVCDGQELVHVDEIDNFRDGRWVSAPEAMWRIFSFIMNEVKPPVVSLQLHLENDHSVTYNDGSDLVTVVANPLSRKTTLTEFFATNRAEPGAKQLLYCDFPEHFVWYKGDKKWKPRKNRFALGRVVSVSPAEGARYYLKVLLGHRRGATSFDDLKMFKGHLCTSFRESAVLHGLVQEDDCFRRTMSEACTYQMPISLRRLFSTLLVYCNPVNARTLWEEFNSMLAEDFARSDGVTQQAATKMCLRDLSFQLESMGKNINDYMLTDMDVVIDEYERGSKEISDELSFEIPPTDLLNVSILNAEQKKAYDVILGQVFSSKAGAFFVDGPGGTGKTFLYSVLLAAVRSKGLIALATASSGVAASILPGGRTAHSRFKIPILVDDQMTCKVSKQSGLAKLLRLSKLIIWDEAPMMRRQSIEAFEQMLRDICECDQPFGGKVVVFGGDFRQTLPVIPKASVTQTIEASLVKSHLWTLLTKFRLTLNMRAQFDFAFSKFLLNVGEGTVDQDKEGDIVLPGSMTIEYSTVTALDTLLLKTFPNLNSSVNVVNCDVNRAILSTKNEFVDELNDMIINRFPGEFQEYHSFDTPLDSAHQGLQEDFFNTLTPSGFPPHLLRLKANCPVILLRNIDPSKGLCNGTRLICKTFSRNVIGAIIATGSYQGKHVFLPRIPLTPPTGEINAFPFQRTQFPIRLCFCMTINKAQGQTLDYVGIYLPQPVFSHGQLYVALSRAKNSSSIAALIIPRDLKHTVPVKTKNVVYREVLLLASTT